VDIEPTLETNAQLAEASEPSVRSLDHPAMLAQMILAFDAFTGNACGDAPLSQVESAPRVVVAFIGVQLAGALSWAAI